MDKPTFYIASKTVHARRWREIRAMGYSIISTWIDEADKGQSRDLVSLACRCISEPSSADFTILYCEEGEHLKFALAEVGAALASGKIVYVIGDCQSVSPTMLEHPRCIQLVNESVLSTVIAVTEQMGPLQVTPIIQ